MRSVMIRGWKPQRKRRRNIGLIPAAAMLSLLAVLVCLPASRDDGALARMVLAQTETFFFPAQIMPGLPEDPVQRLTVDMQRLKQGRMLLVDEAHPIPEGVDAPNTVNILGYTHGRVACRDQQAQLGKEALIALEELCVDARNQGIGHITVTAGTRSQEQQRNLLNEKAVQLSRGMPLEEAVIQAKKYVQPPGCAEHQLPWTVDIRICRGWDKLPEEAALSESEEGRWLTEHAWMYGFVQRWKGADPLQDDHRPYCFRYVGAVHAQLMHELNIDYEEYLALLHTCGALTLYNENGAPVLSAVCAEAGERHTVFEIPENVKIDDASLDNTGYALLAFSY